MGSVVLGLWSRVDLAADPGLLPEGDGFRAFSLAHNVESKEEANAVLRQAVEAGTKLVKPGSDAFWDGYTGYSRTRTGSCGRWPGTLSCRTWRSRDPRSTRGVSRATGAGMSRTLPSVLAFMHAIAEDLAIRLRPSSRFRLEPESKGT